MKFKQWEGFKEEGEWTKEIDVRAVSYTHLDVYKRQEQDLDIMVLRVLLILV